MKRTILFFLFFATTLLNAQNSTFERIKNELLPLNSILDSSEVVEKNLQSFIGNELDSNDVDFLSSGPVLSVLLMKYVGIDLTYQNLFDEMVKFKQSVRNYDYLKNLFLTVEKARKIPVTNNWKLDSIQLIEVGIPIEILPTISKSRELFKNLDTPLNYGQILDHQPQENLGEKQKFADFLKRKTVINIDQIEKSEKPLLIYFRGFAVVNCAKFEQNLPKHKDFEQIINKLDADYNFVVLNVDDGTKLSNEEVYFSKKLDAEVKTIGLRNFDFQMNQFNIPYQPYFVMATNNFEKIQEIVKVHEIENFIDFLKK